MSAETNRDQELVTAFVRARDERSFREMYRRHTPALILLAARLLGRGGSGAEDAVQETWVRAAERLAHFRWESSLRTWLSGILINRCREMIRGREPEWATRAIEGDPPPARAGSGPREADRLDLEGAIRRLPAGYREVFVLHDVEGRTHEEIAALLQVEAGTSKSQLHKARRSLREALSPAACPAARKGDENG